MDLDEGFIRKNFTLSVVDLLGNVLLMKCYHVTGEYCLPIKECDRLFNTFVQRNVHLFVLFSVSDYERIDLLQSYQIFVPSLNEWNLMWHDTRCHFSLWDVLIHKITFYIKINTFAIQISYAENIKKRYIWNKTEKRNNPSGIPVRRARNNNFLFASIELKKLFLCFCFTVKCMYMYSDKRSE